MNRKQELKLHYTLHKRQQNQYFQLMPLPELAAQLK